MGQGKIKRERREVKKKKEEEDKLKECSFCGKKIEDEEHVITCERCERAWYCRKKCRDLHKAPHDKRCQIRIYLYPKHEVFDAYDEEIAPTPYKNLPITQTSKIQAMCASYCNDNEKPFTSRRWHMRRCVEETLRDGRDYAKTGHFPFFCMVVPIFRTGLGSYDDIEGIIFDDAVRKKNADKLAVLVKILETESLTMELTAQYEDQKKKKEFAEVVDALVDMPYSNPLIFFLAGDEDVYAFYPPMPEDGHYEGSTEHLLDGMMATMPGGETYEKQRCFLFAVSMKAKIYKLLDVRPEGAPPVEEDETKRRRSGRIILRKTSCNGASIEKVADDKESLLITFVEKNGRRTIYDFTTSDMNNPIPDITNKMLDDVNTDEKEKREEVETDVNDDDKEVEVVDVNEME